MENNFIESYCKFYHITMSDLSKITGIPYRTLQNWKNGERKAPEYMEFLLMCTLYYIFDELIIEDFINIKDLTDEEYSMLMYEKEEIIKKWSQR